MRSYKFKGDPTGYRWDFPLEAGTVYAGNREAFYRHTVEELYQMAEKEKDKKYLAEWEEVGND